MQKILIVTDCYDPSINGVVTTIKNIKKQAEKDNFQVLIIEPSLFKNYSSIIYPDIRVSIPSGFTKLVDDFAPDYIHIATEGVLGIAALIYCSKRNYNFTTAFHTKWAEFLKSILGIPKRITLSWLRRFHKDKIVFCTSQSMVDYLKENNIGKKHISWSRGVDTEIFNNPRLEKHKFINKPRLLSVGRISKEKNLDEFCSLPKSKYTLTVVGDGPYLKELKSKYNGIKFLGALTGKDLAEVYRNNDAFVFTSKSDTFGIVNIESQMMGTPVAAYDVTGPKDIIVNGVNGWVSDNLKESIDKALMVDRYKCFVYTRDRYTWQSVWNTFKENIVSVRGEKYDSKPNNGSEEGRD